MVQPSTLFTSGLDQGEVMTRLRRLNVELGWDHATQIRLPLAQLGEAPVRAALWSALYAGAHAVLDAPTAPPSGLTALLRKAPTPWDAQPFLTLWHP